MRAIRITTGEFSGWSKTMWQVHFHGSVYFFCVEWLSGADLTFSACFEEFGSNRTVALCEDGEKREVTEENKLEYIQLLCDWLTKRRWCNVMLCDVRWCDDVMWCDSIMMSISIKTLSSLCLRFEPSMTILINSFQRFLPPSYLTHFTVNEIQVVCVVVILSSLDSSIYLNVFLQLMLGGQPSIEIGDLKKGVILTGFEADAPIVQVIDTTIYTSIYLPVCI